MGTNALCIDSALTVLYGRRDFVCFFISVMFSR